MSLEIVSNELSDWERQFEAKIKLIATSDDPAHDLLHFKRVVQTTKKLSIEENANLKVTVPAAWLHDFVIVPKDSPLRSQASKLSAEKATEYLRDIRYSAEHIKDIAHAIEGHSFSANITVNSLEAMVVQDADRLDGLGAIGIARCFATAGLLKRGFYSENDPFCVTRPPNDGEFTIDHFYKKLLRTVETLKTKSGQKEGRRRLEIMKRYLSDLSSEILI